MVGISCRNNHVPHPSQSNAPFAAKRETAKGTRIPINHILLREPTSRPLTQGIRGRDGVSLRNIPH